MDTALNFISTLRGSEYILVSFVVVILTIFSYLVARKYIPRFIYNLVGTQQPKWKEILVRNKTLIPAINLVPALFIYFWLQYSPILPLYSRILKFIIILLITILLDKLLVTLGAIYNTYPIAKKHPIKTFIQFAIIFVTFVGGVVAICVLLGINAAYFVGGIGVGSTIIIFIFSDTIKSFIAGMQIVINKLMRPGDWIEAPQFDADGTVTDVALHIVKVQNWDMTIVNIPTHKLMEYGFKNWRGMLDAGGRLIKRSLLLDQTSVHSISAKEFDAILQSPQIKADKVVAQELKLQAKGIETNLGAFRVYVQTLLQHHPDINQKLALIVTLQNPTPSGIPLDLTVFTKDTGSVIYEKVQSEIFEKLIAITPIFGLRVFQDPSGYDYRKPAGSV